MIKASTKDRWSADIGSLLRPRVEESALLIRLEPMASTNMGPLKVETTIYNKEKGLTTDLGTMNFDTCF